jgi:hypothetical protein
MTDEVRRNRGISRTTESGVAPPDSLPCGRVLGAFLSPLASVFARASETMLFFSVASITFCRAAAEASMAFSNSSITDALSCHPARA